MRSRTRWEPMRLVRVGNVAKVVKETDGTCSPPTDVGVDEITPT